MLRGTNDIALRSSVQFWICSLGTPEKTVRRLRNDKSIDQGLVDHLIIAPMHANKSLPLESVLE